MAVCTNINSTITYINTHTSAEKLAKVKFQVAFILPYGVVMQAESLHDIYQKLRESSEHSRIAIALLKHMLEKAGVKHQVVLELDPYVGGATLGSEMEFSDVMMYIIQELGDKNLRFLKHHYEPGEIGKARDDVTSAVDLFQGLIHSKAIDKSKPDTLRRLMENLHQVGRADVADKVKEFLESVARRQPQDGSATSSDGVTETRQDYQDSTFTGRSERSRTALQQAERLIGKTSEASYQNKFDEFAVKLVNVLETTFSTSTECTRSRAVQREKLWQAFHGVRVSKLVDLWKQLLKSLEEDLDPLVQQYVNQKLYEDIIKSHCCSYPSTTPTKSSLTPDEENIVRYASGYVPMVLMKRHERNVSEKSASFVECLSAMAVNGEESTILEYTTQWVSKVNRGGLFEVNDMAYLLFREIEVNLRDKLTKLLQPSTTVTVQLDRKEQLVTSAIQDDNIQFYWTMLSTDIDDEQDSVELLRDIVELWLTIRGFSIAGQWMEIYKKCSSKTTKKSKSLRKTLKQGTSHTDE